MSFRASCLALGVNMKYLLFLFFFCCNCVAADWKEIQGLYSIEGQSDQKLERKDNKTQQYTIQLVGSSAKDMYTRLKSKEKMDECTGALLKKQGAIHCLFYERAKEYECNFSINLRKSKIEKAETCSID